MTKQLGKAIKLRRVGADMSIKDLAELAGTSQGYLSEIERGKYSPGIPLLSRIAEVFGVKLWQIIKEAEEMNGGE